MSAGTSVAGLVASIRAWDDQEAAEIRTVLEWLAGTDDVYRRVRPATPDPHLVSYVVPVDLSGRVLLGDHVASGRCADLREFRSVRWFAAGSVPAAIDPAFPRFAAKLRSA